MRGTPSGMLVVPFPAGLVASVLPGIVERVWWLPVGLLAVGLLAVLVGRVWGRYRLAAAGSWWELRLGERVSRPVLEAFARTLAGGLPRPVLGARPWVALSVSSLEDRAACGLFISGGLASAQVRAAVEQALGGVTVEAACEALPGAGGGGCLRVASLAAVGSRFLPLRVDHRVDPAGQLLASLRAQEAGEGGVVQLVLQAPARSASAQARRQAARLRSGRGLQSSLSLRALDGLGSLLGGVLDAFTPGSPHPMGRIPTASGGPYQPATLRGYRVGLDKRVLPALGHKRLSDVRRADVQELADRLTAEGLSASTVQNTLDPLRAPFSTHRLILGHLQLHLI